MTERLKLWTRQSGRGMALVQFSSEPARIQVLQRLRESGQRDFEEVSFRATGDLERDVRELVDRVRTSQNCIVSIRGLEDAFPLGAQREKAIDLLNFLRESSAAFPGRQIWWVTFDVARLLRERAPDWLSWFTPKLELKEDGGPKMLPTEQLQLETASLASARLQTADARERLRNARAAGAPSADLWASLAYPAIHALQRAGAILEANHTREEFLDLIYGSSHDASRMARIRQDLASLMQRGAYPGAAILAGEGVELTHEGATPERQVAALTSTGLAHLNAGDYKQAEALLERALVQSQQVVGADHPDTLNSVNNLAVLYGKQGRYAEAEPLFVRALAEKERVLGAEHPDTLTSVNNLAVLYESQGRYGEAEPLHTRALAARERVLGVEHPGTLVSLNNLAVLYQNQGRYGEAEPLYLRALAENERVLGAEHPDTLTSVNNLAGLYEKQGRHEEAEPLYVRALEGLEKVLGTDHPHTVTVQQNLANLRQRQER